MEKVETTIKLCANNYLHWKLSVRAVLQSKNLLCFIDGTNLLPASSGDEMAAWLKKDAVAQTIIINSIDTEHVNLIINATSALEMYRAITNHREQKTVANEWTIKRKLTELKFTSAHTVTSYLSELDCVVKQLKDIGSPLDEKSMMVKILDDLPSSYESLRMNINIAITAGIPINYENLRSQLLMHEKRLKDEMPGKSGEALLTNNFGKKSNYRKKRCYECGGVGHVKSQCRKRQNNQSNSNNNRNFRNNNFANSSNNNFNNGNRNFQGNSNFQNTSNNYTNRYNSNSSYNNQQRGFKPNNSNYNNNSNSNNFNRNRAHVANQNPDNVNPAPTEGNTSSSGTFSLLANQTNKSETPWLFDTGASFHLSGNIKNFTNFAELSSPILLTIGDGKQIAGIAKGDIPIECYNGNQWTECVLRDVLFVPELGDFNLFSWGQTVSKGYSLISAEHETKIIENKSGKVLLTANKVGNTFRLNIRPRTLNNFILTAKDNTLESWHKRLSHINIKKIIEMSNAGILPKINYTNELEDFVCEGCLKGKMVRKPFKTNKPRECEVGEVFHADLQGPMEVKSLGLSRYALVIKDDKSSFRSIYFLKHKSDSFYSLAAYIGYVKRVTGNDIRTMRSDNGGEFIDMRVQDLFENKGINHERSTPYTPQLNGKIERENRTITELARTMLQHRNLPQHLWAEAMATAVYCLNLIPLKNSNGITPYENWYNKTPSYGHLHEFGTICYVLIPEQKRKKWGPKSKKCYFTGYTASTSIFKVYDPAIDTVQVTRDVKFLDNFDNSKEVLDPFDDNDPQEATNNKDTLEDQYNCDTDNESETANEEPSTEEHNGTATLTLKQVLLQAKVNNNEPNTFDEAKASDNHREWMLAMEDELSSLKKNATYDLVKLPEGKRAIGCRWVFRIKRKIDGSIDRFKARLVAQGFSQKSGVDYFETFSPVARYDSIRAILSIASNKQMHLLQFDVKTAFLYGELSEEIYM